MSNSYLYIDMEQTCVDSSETAETPQGAQRPRRLGARPQESGAGLRNILKRYKVQHPPRVV